MTERASIFQGVQIGVESTPGTSVPANKKLQSISIEPSIKAEVKTFRPMGSKFSTLSALGKEWSESKISGQPTYDELTFLLASLVSYAAPAGAGTEKTWTFSPLTSNPDTVKTFTVEQGGSVRAHKFTNGIVTGLTMKFSPGEVTLDGTMMGKALQDGITMTNSPTSIPLIPVLPTQVLVYLADTAAGLTGATALARVLSVEWSLTDRFGPLFVLNNSTSFVTTLEQEPKLTCKLKDEHVIEVSETNPDACAPIECACGCGLDCGHPAVPHGDHVDYLVKGRLHHPHNGHCDDHGPLGLAA